jgi:hypothetical protein
MAIAKQVASLAGNYRNNTWTFLSSFFFLLTGPHMTDKQNTLFFSQKITITALSY